MKIFSDKSRIFVYLQQMLRQLDFHSCLYIQFVVVSCFTKVQEENPASHRYAVGMGGVVQ